MNHDRLQQGPTSKGAHRTGSSSPTVSVLVTTYNGARFIEDQLASIAKQSYPVSQVVICDDRSTDDTANVVLGFIDRHNLKGWTFVVNEINLGPGMNNLTHLLELTGDVVFLADQDDIWESNKVEVMSQHLAERHDLALLVSKTGTVGMSGENLEGSAVERAIQRDSRLRRGPSRRVQQLNFNDFIGYSGVPLHAMCVRGDVVREIGTAGEFPELSKSLGADWYIGIWSTVLGDCELLPHVLMQRRVHDTNVSLGRLHKSTVLSATGARRSAMLHEVRQAHAALLSNSMLSPHLAGEQTTLINRMIDFIGARVAFAENPSASKAARLLSQIDLYKQSAGAIKQGLRMWIADIMYAYGVNWKL